MCECVCVCERERARERERVCVPLNQPCYSIESRVCVCVFVFVGDLGRSRTDAPATLLRTDTPACNAPVF